jgi:uncharacterized protein YjbI with pentapeptide repeats
MGRRYDLALMILGRGAPQLAAAPQFESAWSLRRIVARFGEKAHCPLRRGGHCFSRPRRPCRPTCRQRQFWSEYNYSDSGHWAMADKPDPYDIEALESAVNDSATRVSAIWITFLIFSLYLLIAATTVTQRQLFLAEPVKLPVLNIDLPLWGFFFLTPIVFVILHAYVLLQVLLLGRTAAAYNAAVERAELSPEANISLRQRLANTLFAQIFAGSPREREGFIGWLLKGMAWITLAIAPILILLAFQFSFLPYHSHIATWTHRLLIVIELAAFFLIWPLALNAQRDFQWPQVGADCKRLITLPVRLIRHTGNWSDERTWLRQNAAPLVACLLFVIVSLSIATFPGEPHVNLITGQSWDAVQCQRWLRQKFEFTDLNFDRLNLRNADVIDPAKLERIEDATLKRELQAFDGERTRILSGRDFSCSDLSRVDLRRVALDGAHMAGANLDRSDLRGATLFDAQLQGASLAFARLESANLEGAELQGAVLAGAQLQDAELNSVQLQGANLLGANLQGAFLGGANLRGASLDHARLEGAELTNALLQGASLDDANLQGALLYGAHLQAASLARAELQGSSLQKVELQGANLKSASLQGAVFTEVAMDSAVLDGAWAWRAKISSCGKFRFKDRKLDQIVEAKSGPDRDPHLVPATSANVKDFIDRAVAGIPNAVKRERAAALLHQRLDVDPANDDTDSLSKTWIDCEAKGGDISDETFDKDRAEVLRKIVCEPSQGEDNDDDDVAVDSSEDRRAIAAGIIRNLISDPDEDPTVLVALARGLLGLDGEACAAAKSFDRATMTKLRAAAKTVPTPDPSK